MDLPLFRFSILSRALLPLWSGERRTWANSFARIQSDSVFLLMSRAMLDLYKIWNGVQCFVSPEQRDLLAFDLPSALIVTQHKLTTRRVDRILMLG